MRSCGNRIRITGLCFVALVSVTASIVVGAAGPAEESTGAPEKQAEVAEEVQTPLDEKLRMARLTVARGRQKVGKVVYEDEGIIRLQELGGRATISYPKEIVSRTEMFTLDPHEYYERVGDAYAENLWDFENDLQEFSRATDAYRKSLGQKETKEVQAKYDRLMEERGKWLEAAAKREQMMVQRLRNDRVRQTIRRHQQGIERSIESLEAGLGYLETDIKAQYTVDLLPSRLRNDMASLQQDIEELRRHFESLRRVLNEAASQRNELRTF